MIANSGHDERGKYSGGQAGDQNGTEWQVRSWYKYTYGWQYVLRYPDLKVGKKIAELARKAANNNNIGYNQGSRLTFWFALEKAGYDPSKITTKCDADCSSGVSAIVKAVGYLMNIQSLKDIAITNYTGSMKTNFRAAGFEVLTDEKYLTSDKYLLPGDILLNAQHHTCINLDTGSAVKEATSESSESTSDVLETIPVDDPKGYWKRNAKGWWFEFPDGSYPTSTWMTINGRDYCFDSKGYLYTDCYIKSQDYAKNGKIYYVDKSGAWDGEVYKWMKDNKGWWMSKVGTDEYLKSTWALIDGKWYYFRKSGYIYINTTATIDGKKYTFNKDGAMV